MYKHFREYEKLVIKTVAEPPECCRGCCLVIVELSASSPQQRTGALLLCGVCGKSAFKSGMHL